MSLPLRSEEMVGCAYGRTTVFRRDAELDGNGSLWTKLPAFGHQNAHFPRLIGTDVDKRTTVVKSRAPDHINVYIGQARQGYGEGLFLQALVEYPYRVGVAQCSVRELHK